MESTLFVTGNGLEGNPFYNRRVAYTGRFTIDNRKLSKLLQQWGAEVNNSITKTTKIVLVGQSPNPEKMQKIETLLHDGFHILQLSQDDLDVILRGENWEQYKTSDEVVKDLDFTIEHFNQHHYTFNEGIRNKIAGKELYFCEGFRKEKTAIQQITGNLAAWGNFVLSPQIQIFVLSNSTVEKLQRGEKDESIIMIERFYNQNKTEKFDFSFMTEDDILNFARLWIDTYKDQVLDALYERYINSEY